MVALQAAGAEAVWVGLPERHTKRRTLPEATAATLRTSPALRSRDDGALNAAAEFDIVVVGAGPAGCAVASRVARGRPGWRVALLEAGPAKAGLASSIPIGIARTVGVRSPINYAYETETQTELLGRRGFQPRGRGLGGSSLINAMCYIRGQRQDYDGWAEAGCVGWGWDDVLPYFKRSEDNVRGADALHGAGGPLRVSELRSASPLTSAFVGAGMQAGYPYNPDFNGDTQDGVGRYQVFQTDGRRADAAAGYLKDAPANLTILADTQALGVELQNGRAAGVRVVSGGVERTVRAAGEVVLCAGVFGSAQLLMLSGVGPAEHLADLGLSVHADRPAVGQNLQDHLDHVTSLVLGDVAGVFGYTPRALLRTLTSLPTYLAVGHGLASSNIAEGGGFMRSSPDVERPDIQLHFCIAIVDDHGRKRHAEAGVSLHACLLRPDSRGEVRLASPSPHDALRIDPRYLSASSDLPRMLAGVRIAQKIMSAPAMARYGGKPLYEALDCDDAALEAAIRARADTIYHPVGTCRMGADAEAVVTPDLRVQGVMGLRVADASIMPTLVSGNTQAPSAMIGERAADLILGHA